MKKGKLMGKIFGVALACLLVGAMLGGLAAIGSGIVNTNYVYATSLSVPSFKQCDSRWGTNQLGTCSGNTICSAGCAVTSVAMILKYYGVATDPGDLNNWLRNNSGYASGCLIIWDRADDRSGGSVQWAGKYTTDPSDWGTYTTNLPAQVKWEIDHGYPCVGGLDGHFLVITGYSDSSYYINDSYYNRSTISQSSITKVYTYHGTPPTAYPKPTISVSDNKAEIAVDETDWVKFTVRNDGTEHTSSWGIQVRVGDGLELVEHPSYPWSQGNMCNGKAAEWYKENDLGVGASDYILVGIRGKTVSNYESVWYTAWMYDPDGQPQSIQYSHPVRSVPCDRDYAEYGVKVAQPNISPKPAISASEYQTQINVGETDWVKFTVRNDGTEYTSSWGIQVRVGDGLELVEHPSYPWSQGNMCNGKAAEWYKENDLGVGASDYILVGIKGKTVSNYESVWYTAWMYDPDGQPVSVQYSHPVRSVPCDRDYAEYGVKVTAPISLECDVILNPTEVGHVTNFLAAAYGGVPPYSWLWTVNGFGVATTQNTAYTFYTAGTYTVCVTVTDSLDNEMQCCKTVVVNPALSLELAPEIDVNPVGTIHFLTATLYDQFGYVTEGVAVTWSISGVGSFFGIPENLTDVDGQAHAVITSSIPGTSTVRCEATGHTWMLSVTATKIWITAVPKTWYVDDDLADYPAADFTTIQEAVDAASEGDTIIVYPGTYTENVDVNKDYLTIQSEGGAEATIVQAVSAAAGIIRVTADYANISGFTVKGATGAGWCAIYFQGSGHNTLMDNIIAENARGLADFGSGGNRIIHNEILNNRDVLNNTTRGIELASSNNVIEDNTFVNNGLFIVPDLPQDRIISNTVNAKPLIYLEHESNRTIEGAGQVILSYCTNVTVSNSDLSKSCVGVQLSRSSNCKVIENTSNGNELGIWLVNSPNNEIRYNNLTGNYIGMILYGFMNNNTITDNKITLNTRCGIYSSYASTNHIYFNNFMGNPDNVESIDSMNVWNSPEQVTYTYNGNTYTSYLGNYWSDYPGSDADGDGIGDTPYPIDTDADNYPLVDPFEDYGIGATPPENQRPIASILSLGGQPKTMHPNIQYTVAAAYHDLDGMEDLKYCYLRLNHPTKPLTLMWNQATDEYWAWAGENGANYVTVTGYTVPMPDSGYDLNWQFTINDAWPEVENAIDFGIFAMDDQGAVSGWDYDDTNASFLVTTPGLTLISIEPIQVIADAEALITKKATVIRATVQSTLETRTWVEINVTYDSGTKSYLETGPYGNGVPIDPGLNTVYIPGGPVFSESTTQESWSTSSSALYWTAAGVDTDIELELDPSNKTIEEEAGSPGVVEMDIIESTPLRILIVPVYFPLNGELPYYPSTDDLMAQFDFLRGTYPIADINLELTFADARAIWRIRPPWNVDDWLYSNVAIPISEEASILGYDRVVIVIDFGTGWSGIAIGMLKQPENRLPVIVQNGALGREGLVAHEIGHTYYLWHPHDIGPAVYDAQRFWVKERDYERSVNTFMSYLDPPLWIDEGRFDSDSRIWVDLSAWGFPGTWRWNLFDQFEASNNPETMGLGGAIYEDGTATNSNPGTIILRGEVYKDGTVTIGSWHRLSEGVPDPLPETRGDYSIVLLDEDNQILKQMGFNASFSYLLDMDGILTLMETDSMPFLFNIAHVDGTSVIEIRDAAENVLASRKISPSMPIANVTFPNGGEALGGLATHTVSWEAHDPDGDQLTYLLAYSRDGGATWIPIASHLAESSYAWDTSLLEAGTNYLIKVIASDGVNTGHDISDDAFTILAGWTHATICFDPHVLNLRSQGRVVTAYIELPPGYDVSQIDISSIRLNDTVPALTKTNEIGDYDSDGVPDLMVKFDKAAVQDVLTVGEEVGVTITGEVAGIGFEGSDTISRVITPAPPGLTEWTRVSTPSEKGWVLAPDSVIVDYTVADDGEVAYAIVYKEDESIHLLKSTDHAATWEDITDGLEDALDEDESMNELLQVACDAANPNFVAVALEVYDGIATYSVHVYISNDGGLTFRDADEVEDGGVYFPDNSYVVDFAISPEDDDEREIAIAGSDGMHALIFRCTVVGEFSTGWEDARYDGWDDDGAFTSLAVVDIQFSPSWAADKTILVATATDNTIHLQSGTWGTSEGWNTDSILAIDAVPIVEDVSIPWSYLYGLTAGITTPEDYSGRYADKRYVWVWVNYYDPSWGDPACEIVRVRNDSADPVGPMGQVEDGEVWLTNVSYLGTIAEGKAIAGVLGEGFGGLTDCCEGVQVYRNDNIFNMDICCIPWKQACKPPTGWYAVAAFYVSDDPAISKAYAVALGPDAAYDEGAWSVSFNDGDIWNQISLIDTHIDYLSDVAVSPDCNKTMLVSVNGQNVCGCDSVWLKAENLPEAPEYSGKWLRSWCGQLENNYGMLRLAPEEMTGDTVYLIDYGTDTVYWNELETLACWEQGTATVDAIVDLAVKDKETIYALDYYGDVAMSDDYAVGWHEPVDSKVEYGWTIAVWGDDILIGGCDGDVSHSADGSETFTELEKVAADGLVTVAFDSYFDANDTIYAALAGAGDGNGIYRWVIGESTEWENLGAEDYDYTGLVLDRRSRGKSKTSADTGGVLYASYVSGDTTGVARCLTPAEDVCCGGAGWDYLTKGLTSELFAMMPQALKICGCLTANSNSRLFAIDSSEYYDMEKGKTGTVWSFED